MPELYEYLGIKIFIHANDHLPIHVHAKYPDKHEVRVIFSGEKNDVIKYQTVKGYKPFGPAKRKQLEALVNKYHEEIVNSVFKFVITNECPKKKIITTKIR